MHTERLTRVLARLRQNGVRLWTDGARLRYQAPPGSLTPNELRELRLLKDDLIAFMERSPADWMVAPLQLRQRAEPIPLAFSQQWLWNELELGQRHSMRMVAAAVALNGNLHTGTVRQSLALSIHRHESLRTRIVLVNGVPQQHVDEHQDLDFAVIELDDLPSDEVNSAIQNFGQSLASEPYFVNEGHLIAARLLRFSERRHALIVAADHIISDVASIGILLREITVTYIRLLRQQPLSDPSTSVQFADYAVWQKQCARAWGQKHDDYWRERFAGAVGIRLPHDLKNEMASVRRRAALPVCFGSELSSLLREFGRRSRTTLAMTMLGVYAVVLARWCNNIASAIHHNGEASSRSSRNSGILWHAALPSN
jgi:Condensation domain/TubC N-terminal docking domain